MNYSFQKSRRGVRTFHYLDNFNNPSQKPRPGVQTLQNLKNPSSSSSMPLLNVGNIKCDDTAFGIWIR